MQIYLIGGGGFALEVLEAIVEAYPDLRIAGFFDDDTRLVESNATGLPYLGITNEFILNTPPDSLYAVAQQDNELRERLDKKFSDEGKRPFTVIHPAASISPRAQIADGAYIAAFSYIGPRVQIGRHALINVGASIGHDSILEDYVQLCPGARVSDHAHIRQGAFLGSNAVIPPGGRIGIHAKIAANSFAARAVPDRTLAIGVPARLI
jgi:sugar O-acyltransferase (sialic acid O-acetyltransferase NeuD family)